MAHVFIVNQTTFKVHLGNMFAGTGAADVPTDFIFDSSIEIHAQNEKRSVGMMVDLARIRKGDKIIFFVTGIAKFYGIFEAVSEFFVDPNDADNYLFSELQKKLTYRILIKPYEVYQKGISEYNYLDSLEELSEPHEMCWSLIYRKLGGNRGCTMITDAEYELFLKRIRKENTILSGENFTFDIENKVINATTNTKDYPTKRMYDVTENLYSNMLEKYRKGKAFEHYIQFLAIMTLKGSNYTKILTSTKEIKWIGNEVMCSFGEHRIDVMAIQEEENSVDISLIELKDEGVSIGIINQIESYLVWLKDYILPYYLNKNKKVNVYPIIISDGLFNSRQLKKDRLRQTEKIITDKDWSNYNSERVVFYPNKIIHFKDENSKLVIL